MYMEFYFRLAGGQEGPFLSLLAVLREAMLLVVEPVTKDEIVPRRVCGHLSRPC